MYNEPCDFAEKEKFIADLFYWVSRVLGGEPLNRLPEALTLEIGGSGGVLSGLLAMRVKRAVCTDIDDHQANYGGVFGKLLKEKFERNARSLDLSRIEFAVADAQNLQYRDGFFDLVFSQNAMEHIPDPARAIQEAIRVLRPGGVLFASFDPVWSADTGSHFFSYVPEPWAHLLLDPQEFRRRMRDAGASQAEAESYPGAMNGWLAGQYRERIPLLLHALGVPKFGFHEWRGCADPSHERHPNRELAARMLGCPAEDLMVRGAVLIAQKPALGEYPSGVPEGDGAG